MRHYYVKPRGESIKIGDRYNQMRDESKKVGGESKQMIGWEHKNRKKINKNWRIGKTKMGSAS